MALVTHGKQEAFLLGLANHLFAFSDVMSHQLFSQHMQAGIKAGHCDRSVLAERHSDHHHIECDLARGSCFEQLQMVLIDLNPGGLRLAKFLVQADPVFGIAIALWLLWGAFQASSQAIDQLMDKEWPVEKRRRFVECAARIPELKSLHDLRTRSSGALDFVQFHIAMDARLTVAESHDIVEALEKRLEAEFPGAEVLIHVDPEGQIDQPHNPLAEADELTALRKDRA